MQHDRTFQKQKGEREHQHGDPQGQRRRHLLDAPYGIGHHLVRRHEGGLNRPDRVGLYF